MDYTSSLVLIQGLDLLMRLHLSLFNQVCQISLEISLTTQRVTSCSVAKRQMGISL